jgi:hypothetical protein
MHSSRLEPKDSSLCSQNLVTGPQSSPQLPIRGRPSDILTLEVQTKMLNAILIPSCMLNFPPTDLKTSLRSSLSSLHPFTWSRDTRLSYNPKTYYNQHKMPPLNSIQSQLKQMHISYTYFDINLQFICESSNRFSHRAVHIIYGFPSSEVHTRTGCDS